MVYGPYSGVCLEAQNFPDAPNHPEFPSAILKKGDVFSATIVYRFLF
jgi:aldose 1-epimerase